MSEPIEDTKKRKKADRSSSSGLSECSDQLDYKRLKEYLSISDTEEENILLEVNSTLEDSVMAQDIAKVETMEEEAGDIFAKMEDTLSKRLDEIKTQIVSDLKECFEAKFRDVQTNVNKIQEEQQNLNVQQSSLLAENANLKKKVAGLEIKYKDCDQELKKIKQDLQTTKKQAIETEQYSRRCNIRIYGLLQKENEKISECVLKLIRDKMRIHIEPRNIITAHRLPVKNVKARVNGTDPVIVQFETADIKTDVLRARRNLKGQAIYVNEDLCRDIQRLFNRVRNHRKIDSAWTWNGQVFGKDDDGTIYKVAYGESLDEKFGL